PTRTTARPGWMPRAFKVSTSAAISRLTSSAIFVPLMKVAVIGQPNCRGGYERPYSKNFCNYSARFDTSDQCSIPNAQFSSEETEAGTKSEVCVPSDEHWELRIEHWSDLVAE